MKQLLLLSCLFISATLPAQLKTAFDQLIYVNEQWKYQPDADPALKQSPALPLNETGLIQFHLQETEQLLRKRNTCTLTDIEKNSREENLNTLHSYLQQGLFPVNTLHQNRQPYFIDDYNTYCAVGYLMKESGGDEIAKDIHATQNYSYLADIYHPELMNWVQGSGLTLDELALIQPGYGGEWPCTITEFHYNNSGTDVNEFLEVHESTGQLVGMRPFEKALLFNNSGVLYKTLTKADMQFSSGGYYYTFPAPNSFANQGKVILMSVPLGSNDTLAVLTYSDTDVDLKDYYYHTTRHFSIGENETTPAGMALAFCGDYDLTWTLQSMTPTVGVQQSCITITPVTLSSFKYLLKESLVQLTWQTLTESNNSHFEVERSTNGKDFMLLGKIKAKGNSNSAISYTFPDEHPNYINHYRLKQVDADGKYSYSKVLYVKVPARNGIEVKGTLVKDNLQVNIKVDASDIESLLIYDLHGRKVNQQKATSGWQNIDISRLAVGKYLVKLFTTDGNVYNVSFIKQ